MTTVYEWKPDGNTHSITALDNDRLSRLKRLIPGGQAVAGYLRSEVTFAAYRDDTIVGVAVCYEYTHPDYTSADPFERLYMYAGMRERPRALEIKTLQANKCGLALVEAVKEYAEHTGYNAVVLHHNFSQNTIDFYAKCGFVDPGETDGPAGEDSGFRVFDITPAAPRRSARLRN